MKCRKTIIAGCLSTICLAVFVVRYSGAHGEFVKPHRRLEVRRAYSDLEQDQKIFAADLRRLRRDLRRRAAGSIVSGEREAIVQDWHDIVMDRGLNDPWLRAWGSDLVDGKSPLSISPESRPGI